MIKTPSFIMSFRHILSTFKLTTPIAIIIAACILAGSHVAYGFIIKNNGTTIESSLFTGKPIDNKDYIEGNADSKVVIIEYSDPECPYCVTLHPTLKQIRTDYREKIGFVYRHFPLTQIHPNAFNESKAIACAGTLNGTQGFYAYIDALYGYKLSNQTTQLPATGIVDLAKNGGLNSSAFTACMKSEDTSLTIDTSVNDGVQAGVQGTPSSFVLVKTKKGLEVVAMLDGARPYEYIQAAIEEALSR